MTRARAVLIREPGDPSVLTLGDVDVREPGSGEIAVEVAAAGLNRADLLQRRGVYPPPPGFPSEVPGLEYAGAVAAVGQGVESFRVGDRVMGIIGGGGMSTRVVVHEREAIPIPDGLSFTSAAAIPEVFLTAFDALFAQAELRLGEAVLVHSVGSGVGTALLQLAIAAGAQVIGTSRTLEKLDRAHALGLAHGLVPAEGRFADQVLALTRDRGVDVVLDAVGGAYLEEDVRALATGGRLVLYGTMGGVTGELPIHLLLRKRARVIGTVLRSRPLEEKAGLAQRFIREALPLFASGKLKPVVEAVLPMSAVQQAHERMEENDTFGKLVLEWT